MDSYAEFLRMQGRYKELESRVRYPYVLLSFLVLLVPFHLLLGLLEYRSAKTRKVRVLELLMGKKHQDISSQLNLESTRILFNNSENNEEVGFTSYSDKSLMKFIPLVSLRVLGKVAELGLSNWVKYAPRIIKLTILESIIWRKYECDILVIYNDHVPYCVSAADYFRTNGSKVIYVQHAPVGYHFPPLRWDLSLLYSNRYSDIYRNIAASKGLVFDESKVRIVGDVRLKSLEEAKRERYKISRVLVAYNLLDSLSAVENVVETLINFGYDVILRAHPLDSRQTRFSLDRSSSLMHDLSSCDALICNESGILLEALYCGLFVYKASFLSRSWDNYGFIASGLLRKEYDSLGSLIKGIEQNEITFDEALLSYYTGDLENSINFNEMINEVFN